MVVLEEVALVVRLALHDELRRHVTETRAAHEAAIARMPRREDRAPQTPRHRQHSYPVVDPHRRLVSDPRLAIGLLAVLHVEAADDVRVVVILRRRDRRRILVNAELLEPRPIPIDLVVAQHVEPQLVQRRLAKLAIGDRGKPGKHPAPQPRGDRATPRELRTDFTHWNLSLVVHRCCAPPWPSIAGQCPTSPPKQSDLQSGQREMFLASIARQRAASSRREVRAARAALSSGTTRGPQSTATALPRDRNSQPADPPSRSITPTS